MRVRVHTIMYCTHLNTYMHICSGQSDHVREIARERLMAFVSSSTPSDLKKMEPLLSYLDTAGDEMDGQNWGYVSV